MARPGTWQITVAIRMTNTILAARGRTPVLVREYGEII